MQLLNLTYQTPVENLAIDEQLLKAVDQGDFPNGICRIWESSTYFVVLGLSKKIEDDVHDDACKNDGIPILKRCSGGGTVLQGPGCFNYGFVLPMKNNKNLSSITSTTSYILSLVQEALSPYVSGTEQKGISDLVINDIKFSGNAQRRLKHAILFHGTILYDFNLSLVTKYLKEPPVQPEYRQKRSHNQFIQNIKVSKDNLIQSFATILPNHVILPSDYISDELLRKYR
ncbi:MAG: lipoate--protein ligase family protein [Candidatus Marinamargulisbacteria bacterium]